MKVTQLLVRTLRETPAGAELPSHIFLLRGGYIKQLASGLYSILPLGKRVLHKIEKIIREEMERIEGQEVDLPLVQPSEIWKESGRYDAIGPELCRFKDRAQHPMVLAMTHEEAVTDMARGVLDSYKQLPFMVYQFKLKFRDEPRSRGGLVRVREFVMKDAYSFHRDEKDLDQYYQRAHQAYLQIFNRTGINPIVVKSDTGIMGGKLAHEFMLETPHGEDCLILSEDGQYSANQEVAEFDRESLAAAPLPIEKVATPGQKTIAEVSTLLGITAAQTMKAVLFQVDKTLILTLLRGDLEISEIKVKNFLKVTLMLPAEETLIRSFGIIPGYASAQNIIARPDLRILVDTSISQGSNFVGGANEENFHLKNLNFERDFKGEVGDLAEAQSGHKSLFSNSRLKATRGIEIGNIFKLGNKFTQSMGVSYLDEAGKKQIPIMGCYGIGVGRLMASVVENSHDDFGPIWPKEIAPYHVEVVSIGKEPEVFEACEKLVKDLEQQGFEVLYDDRDERPGVKFKDADLWGVPVRIGISNKTLLETSAEWKLRHEKTFEKFPLSEITSKVSTFYKK